MSTSASRKWPIPCISAISPASPFMPSTQCSRSLNSFSLLMTVESEQLLGTARLSGQGVSFLVDNLIQLRYVEVDGRLDAAAEEGPEALMAALEAVTGVGYRTPHVPCQVLLQDPDLGAVLLEEPEAVLQVELRRPGRRRPRRDRARPWGSTRRRRPCAPRTARPCARAAPRARPAPPAGA